MQDNKGVMHNEGYMVEQTVKRQICFIKTVCCFLFAMEKNDSFFIMDCRICAGKRIFIINETEWRN